jgi:hypothetical protein
MRRSKAKTGIRMLASCFFSTLIHGILGELDAEAHHDSQMRAYTIHSTRQALLQGKRPKCCQRIFSEYYLR